jgi:hypothetical protein
MSGKVASCPAWAPAVTKLMKAIKTRGRTKGLNATRQHAEAMTIKELTYVMEWSEQQCPMSLLRPGEGATAHAWDSKQLFTITKHGLMQAFMSTGFTLWTQYVEPAKLMGSADAIAK